MRPWKRSSRRARSGTRFPRLRRVDARQRSSRRRLYFVRNRLVASGAAAAAALSVVAGLSIGSGPMVQSVLSSRSDARRFQPPKLDDDATDDAPDARSSGSGRLSRRRAAGGNQSSGATQVSHAQSHDGDRRTRSPRARRRLRAGACAPTATLTVVGTGSSAPTAGGARHVDRPRRRPRTTTTTTPPTSTTTTIPVSSASGGAPRLAVGTREQHRDGGTGRATGSGQHGNEWDGQHRHRQHRHRQRRHRQHRHGTRQATPARQHRHRQHRQATPARRATPERAIPAPATAMATGTAGPVTRVGRRAGLVVVLRHSHHGTALPLSERLFGPPGSGDPRAHGGEVPAGKHADAGTVASRRKRGQP